MNLKQFRILLVGLGMGLAQTGLSLPIVDISEDVGGGIGEYTVDIQSPIGENWYVVMFAAENEQSALAGGDGAFVDNGIGEWTGNRFAANQWQAGFDFNFDTPGGEQTLISTLALGNFTALFGTNTFAHAYWPTSYLDFSIGTFSLIGTNETRGGFKFHSPIAASNWVALVQDDSGQEAILTGRAADPTPVPEPEIGWLLLFGLGALTWHRRLLHRV